MTLSIIINGHGSKYIFLFLIFNSFILINVTVPEERSATAIGHKRARDTRNKVKHSQDGDIEGNTALQLVSLLRLPICVTKTPHLSPQHYELNARQHVLDRTRVLAKLTKHWLHCTREVQIEP